MNVYKAIVVHKINQSKMLVTMTAKNIKDLKRRLTNMNYELIQVIEE